MRIKYKICIIRTKKDYIRTWPFFNVPMNIKIDLPENIIGTYVNPPLLANLGIKITEYRTVKKTQLQFFNRNFSKTVTENQ